MDFPGDLDAAGGSERRGRGGTGSADPRNFSAKSTDLDFLKVKVKSESAKVLAENE